MKGALNFLQTDTQVTAKNFLQEEAPKKEKEYLKNS